MWLLYTTDGFGKIIKHELGEWGALRAKLETLSQKNNTSATNGYLVDLNNYSTFVGLAPKTAKEK